MSSTRNLFRALMRGLRKANNRRAGHFTILSQGVVDNEKLGNFLQRSGPFMAGKIGTTELLALEYSDRWIRPLWPKVASWERAAERLLLESGVFPKSRQQFNQFLSFYKDAIQQLDAVDVWQEDPFLRNYEEKLLGQLCPFAIRIGLGAIFTNILAWIAGGQWLVVSPFIDTMRSQSNRLADVHQGKSWAPLLAGLENRCTFVRCPFFSHMMSSPFSSWTEGLERLGETILEKKFDYALIGAGAWSLPLAAKIKRAGRKAIHLGGETQLVFGIKGKRWENFNLYNEHWVRPSPEETPAGHEQKEKGCYW